MPRHNKRRASRRNQRRNQRAPPAAEAAAAAAASSAAADSSSSSSSGVSSFLRQEDRILHTLPGHMPAEYSMNRLIRLNEGLNRTIRRRNAAAKRARREQQQQQQRQADQPDQSDREEEEDEVDRNVPERSYMDQVRPNAARLLRSYIDPAVAAVTGDNGAPRVNQALWEDFAFQFMTHTVQPDGSSVDVVDKAAFLRAVDEAKRGDPFPNGEPGADTIQGIIYLLFNPRYRQNSPLSVIPYTNELYVDPTDPMADYTMIRDMKIFLLIFLLDYLFRLPAGVNTVFFSFIPEINSEVYDARVMRRCGNFVQSFGRYIPFSYILNIYDHVYAALKALVLDEARIINWYEAESGDVFIFLYGGAFHLRMTSQNFPLYNFGARWTDDLKDTLDLILPTGGYVTVKNYDDPFCFLYVLALGIARADDPGFLRSSDRLYEKFSVTSMITYGTNCEKAKELVDQAMLPAYSEKCKMLEEKVCNMYTLKEFDEAMVEVEDTFVPIEYALDVYLLDSKESKRIYPVYSSPRDGIRIKMMILRNKDQCHFCLVTDERKVFRATNGKLFITCSQCHQSFFTQKMFDTHPCRDPTVDHSWHWSTSAEGDPSELVGTCSRCHLEFRDEYDYEYHRKHCMMIGRTGNRYVKLAGDDYTLHGEEVKTSQNKVDRVCFADFECCIDHDSHEHSFMSYGLYDTKNQEFTIGYNIEEFMRKLVEMGSEVKHLKVYFHNAMGYDANFILSHVLNTPELYRDWGIKVIMKSSTKLQRLSFMFDVEKSKHIIEIGDTLHFLTMSLDKIVRSVRKEDVESNLQAFPLFFREFHKAYEGVSDSEIDEILKKNLFPYNLFTSSAVLNSPIEEFRQHFLPTAANLPCFSENITVQDLEKNLPLFDRICTTFKVKTARDYHDIYLRCDVMQITDVFLKAHDALKESHHIDLHDYMGMPSASWHAFLRYDPSLRLPLYKNTIFAEFFQDMVRGGVTSAPLRYAFSDSTHSILYLDVNGLYPFVMKEFRYPCGDFIWRDFKTPLGDGARITQAPIFDYEHENPQRYLLERYFPWLAANGKGCCICVDMVISRELKEKTDQFPFAPEHRTLRDEYFDEHGQLYEFLEKWSDRNDGARMQMFKGLVGTLYDKTEYSVHWRLLWWYMKHGLIVSKIHHCVEFDEGDYLAGYVTKNIEIRNTRKDELGKIVYKLLGNSVYGKTFESPFNRGKFIICRNRDTLRGLIEHDEILSITPIDSNNCVIKLDGDEIVLDKPTYIGACVTEYAKLHMYKIFYDKLPRMFNKVELVYTDTDSFIVRVEHYDNMSPEKLFQHIEECDPTFIGSKGGQLKSETGMDLIDEVIALRSKVYAYRTKSGKIGKRAKGTTTAAQEKELDWETYKRALIELRAIPTANMQFVRKGFQIRTFEMMKVSLSANDGKRQILSDGIHTHAWGYN